MLAGGHSPWMDRARCEQPVTWMIATVPAVNMLLSLRHMAACGQRSYAAPASSRHDPPRAGGHLDMLYGCTFMLLIPVSVKLFTWDKAECTRREPGINARATRECASARDVVLSGPSRNRPRRQTHPRTCTSRPVCGNSTGGGVCSVDRGRCQAVHFSLPRWNLSVSTVTLHVFRQMIAPHETALTRRTGESLFSCVCSSVT